MPVNLAVRSLLSQEEFALANILGRITKTAKLAGRWIYKTQPSAFIDPAWIEEHDSQCRDACFGGLISMAFVRGYANSSLIFAVVDNDSPHSRLTAKILEDFGARSIVVDVAREQSKIVDLFETFLRVRPSPSTTKRLTNKYERWLLSTTSFALGRRIDDKFLKALPEERKILALEMLSDARARYHIFHEPALSSFIDVQDDESGAWAATSRVDLLVTSAPPACIPLIVVEFDGKDHETPRGRARDARKEDVLRRASLPLLRVGIRNVPLSDKSNVIDLASHKTLAVSEFVLKAVIRWCVRGRYQELVKMPERYHEEWMSVLETFKSNVRQQELKINSVDISKDDLRKHLDAAIALHEEELFLLDCEAAECGDVDQWYRSEELAPSNYREFAHYNAKLTVPTISCSNGMSRSSGTLTVGDKQIAFESPEMRIGGFGLDAFDLDELTEDALKLWIVDASCRWLKANAAKA